MRNENIFLRTFNLNLMDDIVVIILTLVVTAFGIYNQSRKKKAASAPVEGQQKQPTDFWDMIMDKDQVAEDETEEFEPVRAETYAEKQAPVPEPQYTFTPTAEGKSDILDEKKEKIPLKRKVKIDGEEFSLRKAVIYNEILKRKYI